MYCVLQAILFFDMFRIACFAIMTDAQSSPNRKNVPIWVHVLIHRTCPRWQMMLRFVSFRHGFRHARTVRFQYRKAVDSFIYEQKLSCGHVDNRKHCRARVLRFQYRNCRQNIGFRKENTYRPHNFCPKPNGAATISIRNRRVRCLAPIAN